MPKPLRRSLAAYAVLCVAMWPFPVLNVLHVESTAVLAFAAFFVAGLSAPSLFREGLTPRRVVALQEAALLVPLALLTVPVLWSPNCGYAQGLLFFLLFPAVTVPFAVAVAAVLDASPLRKKRFWLIVAGLVVSIAGPVYDLGFHPQFYTYNHVFGGVLGPIYDQELALRGGLFAFRGLTLLWTLLLFLGAAWLDRRASAPSRRPVMAAALMLAIGACYFFSARLGINTPAWYIQRALGAHHATGHFDIYYAPDAVTAEEIAFLARDHEYQYARLSGLLDAGVDERIQSYIYPDEDVKARLTGARVTNVAPVWLSDPQTHVLLEHFDDVFPHELAHAFSRAFGLPVLNATLSVGLVEGLAVALEPPSGAPSPHEQSMAALLLEGRNGLPPLVGDVASRLSPLGFWTDRGAVSYTTAGSFVRYLLQAYGPAPFKAAYAAGRFDAAYGKPLDALVGEWHRYLAALPVSDAASAAVVLRRFTVPSLFEIDCPHHIPAHIKAYRDGIDALEEYDDDRALQRFSQALEHEPDFLPALAGWGRVMLARGRPDTVAARLGSVDLIPASLSGAIVLGDAHAILGNAADARAQYVAVYDALPVDVDGVRSLMLLRKGVADTPEVVRALASIRPPEERAAHLPAIAAADPFRQALLALEWAGAREYGRAVAVMDQVAFPEGPLLTLAERGVLERQRLEWLARWSFRSGASTAAASYADRAARAYRRAGDLNKANAADELAIEIRWAIMEAPTRPGN